MREVHQFATSLSYGDAISDEMLEIQEVLRGQGYASEIFIRFFEPRMAKYCKDFREYPSYSSKENVVIFHFSIGSPVSKMFFRIPDRKIMIYHNITPYDYFLDYHRLLARECYKGRLELKLFADKVDLALGDSEFNRRELERAGYPKTGVLPLLMNLTKFDRPGNPVLDRIYGCGKWTLLFVGRVIPNKRFEDVIKVFYFYKRFFNPDSQLILAGDYRGMERYYAALLSLVDSLGLKDVRMTGHLEFSELASCFKMADVYLSMSEHEGFGVPLIEAFYNRTPVVAFAAGAVAETMNGGGILIHHKDHLCTAALLDRLQKDREFTAKIIASQLEALKKYQRENVTRVLMSFVEKGIQR